MKSRVDLLFFYTEYLGFATFEQLTHLFNTGINIEVYLQQKNATQKQSVKLMLFKHYLMAEAIADQLLTKDQAQHLMSQKAWEIKKHLSPFSLLSIDVELIPAEFLKKIVLKFDKNNIFKLDEFRELFQKILRLPDSYKEVIKTLYEKSKPKLKTTVSKIEEDGEIFYKYEIECNCGNFMIFELEEDSKTRMYCNKCRKLVLNLRKKKKKRLDSPGKTLNDIAPDLVRKINIETKRFGHYELLKKIGEGASGKVYLAKNEKTGENVALKILLEPEEKNQLDYFRREIKVLAELVHPNIVALKNWGEFDNKPYLVMEYVQGKTLLDIIDASNNGIIIQTAIKIFINILTALEYAQHKNLIHRDIKPANVMISNNGVKLIDLGIAKILDSSLGLTQTGKIMGTPYYIAPEQVQNFKKVDHRADIYSVGASLFHALCGEPPLIEHSKNTMKLLLNKSRGMYIKLAEKKPDLPTSIISIVEKSMALDLKDRYQTPGEMKKELSLFYKRNTQQFKSFGR